jgi:hypothetical protein
MIVPFAAEIWRLTVDTPHLQVVYIEGGASDIFEVKIWR